MTLEDIESYIKDAQNVGCLYDKYGENQVDPEEFSELCTLAKRGLATMPRPISESPKDCEILAHHVSCEEWMMVRWSERHMWYETTTGGVPISDQEFDFFIPISALDFKP